MKRVKCPLGAVVIAFGIGLFLAYCFPGKFLIIVLALGLIVSGVFLAKA